VFNILSIIKTKYVPTSHPNESVQQYKLKEKYLLQKQLNKQCIAVKTWNFDSDVLDAF